MNKLLETFIRRIIAEGLPFDPLADLDDLIELQRLAGATTGTDQRSPQYLAALHPQLTYAGQTFNRVSIGCRIFAEECMAPWFADDGRTLDLAWCWLMAHARRPDMVWGYQEGGPDAFRAALRLWLRNLPVEDNELLEVVGNWINRQSVAQATAKGDEEEPPQDLSGALEELASEYARPDLNWWIWQAPESEVALLWEKMQERKVRDAGGSLAENPDNPFVRVLRNYRLKENDVWKKLKARASSRASESQPRQPDASQKSDQPPALPRAAQKIHAPTGHTGSGI